MSTFTAQPKPRKTINSRTYPFRKLKPGEACPKVFPMEELHRLRAAVYYYNSTFGLGLVVNLYPDDPKPHCIVGIPAAEPADATLL